MMGTQIDHRNPPYVAPDCPECGQDVGLAQELGPDRWRCITCHIEFSGLTGQILPDNWIALVTIMDRTMTPMGATMTSSWNEADDDHRR